MSDIIITPSGGTIDFYQDKGASSLAKIELTNSNDLALSAISGNLIIGDASRDVYIGDGVNEVDIVFEQNGEIRSLPNKYIGITAGQINATGVSVNGTSVSVIGHTHTSSNITDFNSSVSGLFPTIANSGDNRILTSTGSTVGINAESNLTFDSSALVLTGNLRLGTEANKATLTYTTNAPRAYTIPNVGEDASFVMTGGSQTIGGVKTFSSQVVNTAGNSTTTGGGQIYLNGATGNRIDFNTNGVAAPSFITRSAGTKVVLYPQLSSNTVDYALGIEGNTFWSSVPNNTNTQFRWYGGTTNIATLTGPGVFTIAGSTSQINVDNLRLDGNTLSSTNTNGGIIVETNGTGALQRDSGGNSRGQYAVDLQNVRSTGTMVAAGDYSVIGGGQNNTATSYGVVCGGSNNSVIGNNGFVGGGTSNSITDGGAVSIVGGLGNTSSSYYSSIGGGFYNTGSGYCSTIPGGMQAKASRHGELSHSAGMFTNNGDAQHTILIARRLTTTDTAQLLYLDGNSSKITLPTPSSTFDGTMWNFDVKLSAYGSSAFGINQQACGYWTFRGAIARSTLGGTRFIGSVINENNVEQGFIGADASIIANNTDGSLDISVTGKLFWTIRWVATIDISQVINGNI
jgi:hypothetical protein